jgi:hypothetical protein
MNIRARGLQKIWVSMTVADPEAVTASSIIDLANQAETGPVANKNEPRKIGLAAQG